MGVLVAGKTKNEKSDSFKTVRKPPKEWINHYNHHTPIVDDITFYSVQRILSQHKAPISESKKAGDFFLGKLYCGICGRKMRLKRSVNGSVYYICPHRDESASSCMNKSKSEKELKKQVFPILCELMNTHKAYYDEMLAYENSPYSRKK